MNPTLFKASKAAVATGKSFSKNVIFCAIAFTANGSTFAGANDGVVYFMQGTAVKTKVQFADKSTKKCFISAVNTFVESDT